MKRYSIQHTVDLYRKQFNDESKLCFGAAVGCLVVGALGWLINYAAPETTTLHGLLVVGVFYSARGTLSLLKRPTKETESLAEKLAVDASARLSPEKDRTLKSVA